MLKLISLELRKVKITGYIRNAFIAMLAIAGFITLMYFDHTIKDYKDGFTAIETFVQVTFTIFAAVLISRLVIEEYRSKTISTLFMYPINRKKLIVAKLLIVILFTFIAIVLSDILIAIFLYFVDSKYHNISGELTLNLILKELFKLAIAAFSAAGLSLISLFFGMKKKSTSATIVTAVILVSITSSNSNGFSLNSIIAIPLSLACLGLLIAYLSFRNIEKVDVE
ncbi:ABC transporter permease [Bacillus sp. 03113]|uniref:ABC transporter permease n=1 Tax=Bacillus sp. 03113 TaxID=2578211 RepID=UPI00114466FC|nr:ABC transporter permease [Bacillus sp. 03113]